MVVYYSLAGDEAMARAVVRVFRGCISDVVVYKESNGGKLDQRCQLITSIAGTRSSRGIYFRSACMCHCRVNGALVRTTALTFPRGLSDRGNSLLNVGLP